ncbi:heme-binding domain-containing protein [Chryseobacterium arthrosphaerae]|uniref:heme-binding domain-containing protein n=1 Tax=Chryseobacterium arthrosphaerae TaxID=651561 RepID=UPI001F4AC8C7|nr:heme-binding domain-containing protein [Chryseobacterium arthrosphaerae]MDG4650739.1 heme-binding domain-containing protein [Chryseobacterium arthrosphaerae]
MKTVKKVIFWTLVAFALIQFIPIDRVNKPVDSAVNFVDSAKAPEKVSTLLKNACYDCHSNETVYPKYAFIAPISWSVKSHVNEGREHMNFSVWGTYNKELKESMLNKSVQTLQNKTMPMPGYIVYHKEANLSEAERSLLIQYFDGMLKSKTY